MNPQTLKRPQGLKRTKFMQSFNYHCHTTYSDGKHSLQDYVQQAIAQNLYALGFSDHAPVPMNCNWAMADANKREYRAEVQRLKHQHRGTLEIYAGLEIDYIPGKISPGDAHFKEMELDYCIGAVHFVDHFEDGTPWSIDGNEAIFRAGLKTIFKEDIRMALHRYFQLIREMVTQTRPAVVAHLDRIKKNNPDNLFYDERESWYRTEVEKTLEVIAQHDAILEVNTKSLYRNPGSDPYPSKWIIGLAQELEIPVHLASDAHFTHDLTGGFDEAFQILLACGHQEVSLLIGGAWRKIPINEKGLVPEALEALTSK